MKTRSQKLSRICRRLNNLRRRIQNEQDARIVRAAERFIRAVNHRHPFRAGKADQTLTGAN